MSSDQPPEGSLGDDGSSEGGLPPVLDLLQDSWDDYRVNLGAYLLTGLALMLVSLVLVGIGYVIGVFAMVGAVETGSVPVMVVGILGGLLVILLAAAAMGPMIGSTIRAIWAHQVGEGAIGFGAPFSTLGQGMGAMFGLYVMLMGLGFLGMLACYVGFAVVHLFTLLALPAVAVHGVGPIEAIKQSATHVRGNFIWYVGFWPLALGILIVSSAIPILGGIAGLPFYFAFLARGYAAAFGTGEFPEPVHLRD